MAALDGRGGEKRTLKTLKKLAPYWLGA